MSAAGESAGLLRRLGAFFYDALLLTAVLMVVTALLLPITRGEAITPQDFGWLEPLYQLFLLAVMVLYFGIGWTRSGQTLGMRAWKIRVMRTDGQPLRWSDALIRFAAAVVAWLPAGLGVVWMLIDREKRAWQDRWSRTWVVNL